MTETPTPLANTARGEACLTIDGTPHRLCLTLGALAELESSIGKGSLTGLQERLSAPTVSDMLLILHALLRGGADGAFPLTLEALKASNIDLGQAARAISSAFAILSEDP